jgi:hypothetical protein
LLIIIKLYRKILFENLFGCENCLKEGIDVGYTILDAPVLNA